MGLRSGTKKITKRVGNAFGTNDLLDKINILDINADARLDSIVGRLNELNESLARINENLEYTHRKIDLLESRLVETSNYNKKICELYFQALFKKDSESDLSMRKRFFRKLPTASGDLRLLQLGNAKLLKIMHEICEKNHIQYSVCAGTLLGAIRHGGIIPWDDDVDVMMTRDNIKKFVAAIGNTNYRVTVAYDWYVMCRQIRFRSKSVANPCFVDIFIYDYANDNSRETWQNWQKLKTKYLQLAHDDSDNILHEWHNNPLVFDDDGSQLSREIRNLFNKTYGDLYKPKSGGPGAVVAPDDTGGKGYKFLMWGMDNLYPVANPDTPRIYEKGLIYPTKQIMFEGFPVMIPNNPEEILYRYYGDFYQLPDDLVSHFQHIDRADLNIDELKKFIGEA